MFIFLSINVAIASLQLQGTLLSCALPPPSTAQKEPTRIHIASFASKMLAADLDGDGFLSPSEFAQLQSSDPYTSLMNMASTEELGALDLKADSPWPFPRETAAAKKNKP